MVLEYIPGFFIASPYIVFFFYFIAHFFKRTYDYYKKVYGVYVQVFCDYITVKFRSYLTKRYNIGRLEYFKDVHDSTDNDNGDNVEVIPPCVSENTKKFLMQISYYDDKSNTPWILRFMKKRHNSIMFVEEVIEKCYDDECQEHLSLTHNDNECASASNPQSVSHVKKDVTNIFNNYLGPGYNFYGIPTTPEMLGMGKIEITYKNRHTKIFNHDQIIELI